MPQPLCAAYTQQPVMAFLCSIDSFFYVISELLYSLPATCCAWENTPDVTDIHATFLAFLLMLPEL